MLLQVTHETRYAYSPAVETAQHMAHLRPRGDCAQRLLGHRLRITPEPDQLHEHSDVHGNSRAFFSLQTAHEELVVEARSRIATQEPVVPDSAIAWQQARERYRYRAGGVWEPAAGFVFPSFHVRRHDDFTAYAQPSFACHATPLVDGVLDLMHRLHEDMRYDPHSTEVNTPAVDALRARRGVCQDFAHIMISCLRALGLPARYVSGYLLTHPPPGRPRLVGSDASHAWVSVYLPDAAGWWDFDPTNDRRPGADYVTLAVGRDYADVAPIRGVIHGGAGHTLDVAVTVEPIGDEDGML